MTGKTGRMKRWWGFWVDVFAQRESASGLALFRIALGLVILYSLVSILAADLIDVLWIDVSRGGYGPQGRGNFLLAWLGGPVPEVVYPVYVVAIVAALAMTVGLGGRVVIFITLQTYNALVSINANASGGYDLLITNALWLLVLGDAMATYSLRCRWKTGKWARHIDIAAWPRYLLAFQLIVTYTATGLYKLSADWTPAGGYSALYHVLQDPTWRRFDMAWTAWVYPLTQVATAVVWFWEATAWVLLLVFYFRYTRERPGRVRAFFNRWDLRIPFALMGVCMHVGILIALDVGPFSWVSLSYYICLFRPEEVVRALARLVAFVRRRSPEPVSG